MSKDAFNEWWNSGEVSNDNPYTEETPIWWAWEGYLRGINADRTTKDSSAVAFAIREQRKESK